MSLVDTALIFLVCLSLPLTLPLSLPHFLFLFSPSHCLVGSFTHSQSVCLTLSVSLTVSQRAGSLSHSVGCSLSCCPVASIALYTNILHLFHTFNPAIRLTALLKLPRAWQMWLLWASAHLKRQVYAIHLCIAGLCIALTGGAVISLNSACQSNYSW